MVILIGATGRKKPSAIPSLYIASVTVSIEKLRALLIGMSGTGDLHTLS